MGVDEMGSRQSGNKPIINANSLHFSLKVHYGYSQTCVK